MLKPLPKQEDYIAKIAEDEENVTYKSISAVKLGCNRCMQVFYSEGGYNDHLFKKHRVRNVLRNPLTVINKLWSKILERQPLFEGQNECEICGAWYFDKLFYYRCVQSCKKPTVEEFEEKQHDLYVVLERDQKQKNEEKSDCTEEDNKEEAGDIENEDENNIISPSQPKKARRSRSRKRNWTTTKRRKRQTSISCPLPSKRYVKSQVETDDLSKSDDKKENVEFYENVTNDEKKKEERNKMENAQGTPMETSPITSSTIPSRHENDTDFEVMQTPEMSTSSNTEDSLPTIRRPKTRYQAQMEKRAIEMETGKKKIMMTYPSAIHRMQIGLE